MTDGEKIKDHFTNKGFGVMDALFGEFETFPPRVLAMKEEDCDLMMMSTYETNERLGEDKFRTIGGERITFKYPDTVHNHYQYIDDVYSHKARHQVPISLEDTWSTKRWGNQILPFCWICWR